MNTHLGFLFILLLWGINASATRIGCQEKCGNVRISYPFGIGKNCSFDEWYEATCNSSDGFPKRPFLRKINLELLEISNGTSMPLTMVSVNIPIISSGCSKNNNNVTVNLSGSPFFFSVSYNRFTVIGCGNYATMTNQKNSVIGGCLSICNGDQQAKIDGCYGLKCCQTTFSPYLKLFKANISDIPFDNSRPECRSAFMVDKDWLDSNYPISSKALVDKHYVPAQLQWGIYNGTCRLRTDSSNATLDSQNYRWIPLSSSHACRCYNNYAGNCYGAMICLNNNCSECPDGHHSSRNDYYSSPNDYYASTYGYYSSRKLCIPNQTDDEINNSRVKVKIIAAWWLNKFVKRRRQIKLRQTKLQQKFFKRNGCLLLQQELSSNKGNVDRTKLFTSKELVKAADNYNANRILGQGGQGTVYKGMLMDGRIVAVKKSKIADESKVEEFINEVVNLSQINHRNVVKLLGCCLETEVPLLVYEFIPNGTLFQYLHDQTEEFPITWEMRLRIAVDVSGALSYLHSAASIPFYHRDIKSANILLDDKYRAKVSDFGTSRSITVDQTHLTTQVQGTFGYLDPEYFRSSQFTDKSDVYSFGVVLAELLTGQKSIRSTNAEEDRSLAAYFLCAMKENRLFELLDSRVLKEGGKEEIITVARLAQRCLNLNGKKRPTMKEVETTLMGIEALNNGDSILAPNFEEMIDYEEGDIIGHNLETGSSSTGTGSFFNASSTFSVDADPLILNKW